MEKDSDIADWTPAMRDLYGEINSKGEDIERCTGIPAEVACQEISKPLFLMSSDVAKFMILF